MPRRAGQPGYLELTDEPSPSRNRLTLDEEVIRATVTRGTAEWVESLDEAGAPCGALYTVDHVFADPQVKHPGVTGPVHLPKLGEIRLVNRGGGLSRTPATMARATPERSEQTAEILREIGYDEARIADLRLRNVV